MTEETKAGKPGDTDKGHGDEKATVKPQKALKNIIRFGETNIDGSKRVGIALREVRGVSFAFSNAVVKMFGHENKSIGDLSETEMKALEDVVNNPERHNIPSWFFNRRRDPDSDKDRHILTSNLEFTQKMDIDKMKKVKSYRGMRHIAGLPVRGQRTRGSFRKGKVVGVSRKAKARQAAKSGK